MFLLRNMSVQEEYVDRIHRVCVALEGKSFVNTTLKSLKINDDESNLADIHKLLSFMPNLTELEVPSLYVSFTKGSRIPPKKY